MTTPHINQVFKAAGATYTVMSFWMRGDEISGVEIYSSKTGKIVEKSLEWFEKNKELIKFE